MTNKFSKFDNIELLVLLTWMLDSNVDNQVNVAESTGMFNPTYTEEAKSVNFSIGEELVMEIVNKFQPCNYRRHALTNGVTQDSVCKKCKRSLEGMLELIEKMEFPENGK